MAVLPAYFDTSVLLKRYVREVGSAQAQRLLRAYRIITSALAPVEVVSALTRRRQVGDLTADAIAAIQAQLSRDRLRWAFVEVTPEILSRSEKVIAETQVRTLDAIHLASALTVQAGLGDPTLRLLFVTGDKRQREAAEPLGLDVRWVG